MLIVQVALLGLLLTADATPDVTVDPGTPRPMPPFVLLKPPTFKAGHTATVKLLLFAELTGNITVKYYNYTRQYYPEPDYKEYVIRQQTLEITDSDRIINIELEVPESVHGNHMAQYSGYLEGFGPFSHPEDRISVTHSGYKTYVQTDKPIYKPGQPIRFRGFSIDSDLKGLNLTDGMQVRIKNPDYIEVFNQVVYNEGGIIHEGVFLLADEVKIGDYRIYVSGRNDASCTFSVEEYVLPKFGVEIEGPKHIGSEEDIVRGKVTATYTYGKPVNGRVVLKFFVDNKSQRLYTGAYHFKELTMDMVDGKAEWEIDMGTLMQSKLKYLFNPWCTPSKLVVHASVSDSDGGFNAEKTDDSTSFTQSSIKLTFNQNTERHYAAGFPYYVELDVATVGSGVNLTETPVTLTLISGLTELSQQTKEVFVKNGKVFASFNVPEKACAVKVHAEMKVIEACSEIFTCHQPERLVNKNDEFIRFNKAEPASYVAGETAIYQIVSNNYMQSEQLHYLLLSKGNIVKSWSEEPDWEKITGDMFQISGEFILPEDMITRSRLLVFSANPTSGYLMVDSMDICVTEQLSHNVSMEMSAETARPGQNVTVTLTSDPHSFLGITVNDASLELMREPCKVLTEDATLSFLRDLDGGTKKELTCQRNDPYQCKSNTEVKIIDMDDLLRMEGVDISTNMNLFNYEPPREESNYNPYGPYGNSRMYKGNSSPTYMAGEMAMSSAPSVDSMVASDEADDLMEPEESEAETAPRVRNFFPEAWLWTDVVSDENGTNTLTVSAPDTITGWKGSAFGLSPDTGLGFSNEVEFQTFLPFFVRVDLPYAGTVGERITLPIRVYNYLDEEITATVEISSALWEDMTESVTVESNRAATIEYNVSLTEAGSHEITVIARSSSGDADAVEKLLLVKPGGEKIVDTHSLLIMEDSESSDKTVMTVSLPDSFIPGSHDLKMVAVGDILGEAVSGISNLIQLPSGCGEQNMHKIAINVFAANYLRTLYKDLPEHLEYNINHNLNIGLQKQLSYRISSRGYSVFRGGEASTWLSAFVYRIFKQFPEDVFLPCSTAIDWDKRSLLGKMQYVSDSEFTTTVSRNGWAPFQYQHHKAKDLYWNSFYTISMLENEENARCGETFSSTYYNTRMGKVCNATFEMLDMNKDCCYYHMVEYATQLCLENGHYRSMSNKQRRDLASLLESVDGECLGSSRDGKYKFATCQDNLEMDGFRGNSKTIESTGYAVLLMLQQGRVEDALPLVMWLASQRNENGGFRSSQDTVIGLQALSVFAEMIDAEIPSDSDLTLVIGKGRSYFERLVITGDSKLTTKEVILSPAPGDYKIKWTGIGVAFVQLISTYHVTELNYLPVFMLKTQPETMGKMKAVKISFTLPPDASSTMYLLEVTSPTGLVFTKSLVEGQMQLTDGGFSVFTRYDIKEGGQRVQLYVDPASVDTDVEFTIPMNERFVVENRAPAQVSLVDYYNPSERQTVFYTFEEREEKDEKEGDMKEVGGGCAVALSCDLLSETSAIVIGNVGEVADETVEITDAFALKTCQGNNFIKRMRAEVKYGRETGRECADAMGANKGVFLLRYAAQEGDMMEVTAMAQSKFEFFATCVDVINQCPDA